MTLNPHHKKIQTILDITGLSFPEIDNAATTGEENTDWWMVAHVAIRALDLPDEERWLEGLKGQSFTSAQEVLDCIAWHRDEENLEYIRSV